MTRKHLTLIVTAGVVAFALGFAQRGHSTVAAAPEGALTGATAAEAYQAPPGLDGAGALIDEAGMQEVAALTEKITPYLYLGDDKLVHLRPATAAEIGVSEEFLANFKASMTYSNQALAAGDIVVHEDLTVSANAVTFQDALKGGGVAPVKPGVGKLQGSADEGGVPQWGAWRYPQGAIFYNSHGDWQYYRNAYYGLCNSMAAYLGYPWMSGSLIYFYGYNQMYFGRYVGDPGVYWYMPYSYCNTGLGYKPAYWWGPQYMFNYGCGCYQYQYVWIGVWCRY